MTVKCAALIGGGIAVALCVALAFWVVHRPAGDLEWEIHGFKNPESVLFDMRLDRLYVSNMNGRSTEKDGNGYISLIGLDGTTLEEQWATGLDAPKGMALHEGRLYVADVGQLIKIDVADGTVVMRYPAPNSKLLNDVAADEMGNIYVSDSHDNAIYRLAGGIFKLWLKDDGLASPNGLIVEGDLLLIAALGNTEVPGNIKAVSLAGGAVTDLGDGTPVGFLDGIELDGRGGYLVTDFGRGALLRVEASGKSNLLIDYQPGGADLEYIAPRNLAIIPMLNDGKLSAYRLD